MQIHPFHGWVVWICKAQTFRAFALTAIFRAFAPKLQNFAQISRICSRFAPRTHTSHTAAPRPPDPCACKKSMMFHFFSSAQSPNNPNRTQYTADNSADRTTVTYPRAASARPQHHPPQSVCAETDHTLSSCPPTRNPQNCEQPYQPLPARWLSQCITQRAVGASTKAADREDRCGGRDGDAHTSKDGV